MLYAGFYNLSGTNNKAESRRASTNSATSSNNKETPSTSRRSSLKKVLDSLRPTEQPITPAGIYKPVIENGPLFSRRKSEEWKKMSRWEKNAAVADMMH